MTSFMQLHSLFHGSTLIIGLMKYCCVVVSLLPCSTVSVGIQVEGVLAGQILRVFNGQISGLQIVLLDFS